MLFIPYMKWSKKMRCIFCCIGNASPTIMNLQWWRRPAVGLLDLSHKRVVEGGWGWGMAIHVSTSAGAQLWKGRSCHSRFGISSALPYTQAVYREPARTGTPARSTCAVALSQQVSSLCSVESLFLYSAVVSLAEITASNGQLITE